MSINKLFLFLLLLVLTIGAVSAVDIDSSDDIVSTDSNSNSNVLSDEESSSQVINITNDNYKNYFDNTTGKILSNSTIKNGDTLKIGNISNKYFIINMSLNITSISSKDVMNNSGFLLIAGSDFTNITGIKVINNISSVGNTKLVPLGLLSTSHVNIKDCTFISNTTGYGNLEALAIGNSSYCNISNCTFQSVASCIRLANAQYINITGSKIKDKSANLIYFMPSIPDIGHSIQGPSNNILIKNNYLDATDGADNTMAWGIRIMSGAKYYVCNVSIINNTICNTNKVVDTGCDGLTFINNTVFNVQNGVDVRNVNNVTISGNNFTLNNSTRSGQAITINGGSAVIEDNIINNTLGGNYVISIKGNAIANITGNNITTNSVYGISLSGTKNTTVSNNKIIGKEYTGDAGIQLSGTNTNLTNEKNYPNTIIFVSPDGKGNGGNIATPTNLTSLNITENITTIYFKKGTYNITQTLNFTNLTLKGEDAVTTILDGQGKTQIANLNNVSIIALTFANGKGAIINNGILNITGCIFINNNVSIYNNKSKKLNVTLSIFYNNTNPIINNGTAVLDYNWWGSNANPNSTLVNCSVKNWIVMNAEFEHKNPIKLLDTIKTTVDFNNYTNGTKNFTFVNVTLPSGFKITINNDSYVVNNGKASNTYTANMPGNHSIVVKGFNQTIVYNFTVQEPTIIFVSPNGTGSGNNSTNPTNLTYALSIIGGNDTIYFLNGVYKNVSNININKNLNLIGENKDKVIFDGVKASFIKITSGNVNIVNLTILNSNGTRPPIDINNANGNINIINCTVANGTANGYGGAMYVSGSATVNVLNSVFENNTSKGYGGAFYLAGSSKVTVKSSVFKNNKANDGDNGQIIYSSQSNGAYTNISNSVLLNNNSKVAIYSQNNYVTANNNWWGQNIPLNNTKTTVNNWLVMTLENSEFLNSTNITVAFKISDKNGTISDYNGSLPTREFTATSTTGTVKPTNGTISNSVVLNYVPNKLGEQTVTITIDNQNLTFSENYNNNITSDDVVMYFKNGTRWEAVLTDPNGKPISGVNLTFTINGVSYNKTTGSEGNASIGLNLAPDVYNATVSYITNESNVTKEVSITVLSTVQGNDTTLYFKNGTKYNALFLDGQGNPLKNTNVSFNINGVMYPRTTDENGLTTGLTINLRPGTYIITATNPVTGQMFSNNITVLPTIISNNITKYYKNGTQFEVKVVDGKGNALSGQTVVFNINGLFYNKTTDENGIAVLSINLAPGEYVITSECNGCTVSNTITVLPTIIGEEFTTIYQSGGKFNVKVVDGQGNPQENVNISFNINGMFYYRTTTADGTTSGLTINLQPGEYIITTSRADTGATISNTVIVTI